MMSQDDFGTGMSFVSRKASGFYEISIAPSTKGKWFASIVADFGGKQSIHQEYLWFDEDPRFLMLFLWGHHVEFVGEHLCCLIEKLEERLDKVSLEEIFGLITDFRDSAKEVGEKLYSHMIALGIRPSLSPPPLDTFNFSSAFLEIGRYLAKYLDEMSNRAAAIQQSGRKFLAQLVRDRIQELLRYYLYWRHTCL